MKGARASAVLVAALAAAAGPAPAQTAAYDAQADAHVIIDTLELRAHTRFLADNALAGRAAGSPGERIAAAYIAAQLIRLGLEPLGSDDAYLEPVPLAAARILPGTRMRVVTPARGAAADTAVFVHGEDFLINAAGRDALDGFDGPALLLPERLPDSLPENVEVAGRVLVALGGLGPDAGRRIREWQRRGALAVVLPTADTARVRLIAASRGPERLYIDAPVNEPVWQPRIPLLIAGPRAAARILDRAGRDAGTRAIELPVRIALDIDTDRRPLRSANVVGLLRGRDPELRDEYIAYTAHYDHLGIGTPVDGDSIYNGFSDNAAGVAMLLAIANAMKRDPPRRSVLFFFFAAEERGLLGSTYHAMAPVVPLDRISAVINLDAGAPPAPPISWRIAGSPGSPLAQLADSMARSNGWTTQLGNASPNSDHWAFLSRGVPSIFIIPGDDWQDTDESERAALRARWERYHMPGNEWAPDFPFAGLARYAAFALNVGRAAANDF